MTFPLTEYKRPSDSAARTRSPPATARRIDVAQANGATYLGIVSAGIDSDIQVIANSTRLKLGNFVYVYGTLAALISARNCLSSHWAALSIILTVTAG